MDLQFALFFLHLSGFTSSPTSPQAKTIKPMLLTGVRLVTVDLSISASPPSPCQGRSPAPGKPVPQEHCCRGDGLGTRTVSLTGVSFPLLNAETHNTFFCPGSSSIRQADYSTNRTGERKVPGLQETDIKLVSSAARCLGFGHKQCQRPPHAAGCREVTRTISPNKNHDSLVPRMLVPAGYQLLSAKGGM